MFNYLYNNKTHTDTTPEYMTGIGMDEQQIESVLQQQKFELSQNRDKRKEAYNKNADPVFIEWQYELASGNPNADEFKQKWLDSVKAIKEALPI